MERAQAWVSPEGKEGSLKEERGVKGEGAAGVGWK